MNVLYSSHVQDIGWQEYVSDGAISGTTGQSKRLEAIKINLDKSLSGGIEYSAHVQNIGWQGFVSNNEIAGTTRQALRLEAIKLLLTGEAALKYDVYYQCHVQNIGWMGWAKNGEPAGTTGYAYRCEAICIRLVNKDDPAPGPTTDHFREFPDPYVLYSSHVQDIGWQEYVSDGAVSGTMGQALRLEAIKIKLGSTLSGGIEYSAHVENIGWQSYVANDAVAGTIGQSFRLEAIKILLMGEAALKYDVYYQCHVQDIGWMGWAKNGEPAGTTGYAYRCEAICIQFVNKGDPAPGPTTDHFRENKVYFRYPVNFIGITGPFVPGPTYDSSHFGIDFGTQAGGDPNPPVYLAIPGIVDEVRPISLDSAGKYVKIRYDDTLNNCTWYTYHKHLDSINVYAGQILLIGAQIGIMGSTGTEAIHLHFDLVHVRFGEEYNNADFEQRKTYSVDPISYLYKYPDQTIGEDTINTYPILIL